MRYDRPTTLDEALAIRAERAVLPLAGGTDIYPAYAQRKAWGDASHGDILDLSALPGLGDVIEEDQFWRLGALVTWSGLEAAALPPLFDALKQAGRHVGGRQVQNRGTLAGNLCTASPAGDGIPNLLAMDAEVELASKAGRRRLQLPAFNIGYRQTAVRADEIVTAILVPKRPAARSAFVKLGARHSLVISIAMAAAVVSVDAADVITEARLAVGACSPVARRLPLLEQALLGQPLSVAANLPRADHLAALTPIDDIRASAAYRRDAALTLVRDVLAEVHAARDRKAA